MRLPARLLTAALCCGAALLRAQTPPPAPRPAVRQTASINLLGLPFGFASGEYERAVGGQGFAVGVGGLATFSADDAVLPARVRDSFRSLQAKLKYYPAARGLRGFAVGVTGGVASSTRYESYATGTTPELPPTYGVRRTTSAKPTLGAVLDYNFLLGPERRFLVGVGVGGRRVLGVSARPSSDWAGSSFYYSAEDRAMVDGRLQVGFGF